MSTICDKYREWALEAVEEWDGVSTAELFTAILDRTGESLPEVLFDDRAPTDNERHLLNLLSWRESENKALRQELLELRR